MRQVRLVRRRTAPFTTFGRDDERALFVSGAVSGGGRATNRFPYVACGAEPAEVVVATPSDRQAAPMSRGRPGGSLGLPHLTSGSTTTWPSSPPSTSPPPC